MTIAELQQKVRDKEGFPNLESYQQTCLSFLEIITRRELTRIVSPSTPNYVFFQFDESHGHRITRPINTDLFLEDPETFSPAVHRFLEILELLRSARGDREHLLQRRHFDPLEIDRVIYTIQQSIGSVGDSFPDANQSRKRIGQLFEGLIRLIITAVGVSCEPRTVNIPLPGHPGRRMSYELDLVFSRGNAIVTAETKIISPTDIVGSVKTTSKDRIDKVFLDKFLLSRLLGRDVRVVAIFLHDVQRAKKAGNPFGVNSTFKTNHFLGYTLALNRLDGVYYVDPRPVMTQERDLAREIKNFSHFLTTDLWAL